MEIKIKVTLFKGKTLSGGCHPIQLQYEVDGIPRRKGILKCHPDDWDSVARRVKSKVTNSAYMNRLITQKYSELESSLLKIASGDALSSSVLDKQGPLTLDSILLAEIKRFEEEIKPGAAKRFSGYQIDLAKYLNSKTLNVANIDLRWYEKYANFLASEIKVGDKIEKKKNIGATVQKKIKTIRRLIEKYTKTSPSEDIKKFKVKQKKPIKHKWSTQELERFQNLQLEEGTMLAMVRDFFLLQIYTRGSRVGALLQAYSHQFTDGRYLASNDEGKNNVSCKLIPAAQDIVDKYKNKYERLFPFFRFTPDPLASEYENKRRRLKVKEARTAVINKHLKKLAIMAEVDKNKKTSSHLARHIFTKKAIDKISNPMITMELLGHSTLAVHQQYLNDIRNDDMLDDAADDIFS